MSALLGRALVCLACAASVPSWAETAIDWSRADAIVASIELPDIPDVTFDIRDYGAQPGEHANALPALQQAIDTASQAGGGRVVVPEGVWYLEGPVRLKSRVDLHLQSGSRLLFAPEAEHYLPVVKQRWEGTEVFSYSPLIYARDVTDVAISGSGIIDGNANSEFHGWHQQQAADVLRIRKLGFNGVPVEQRVFAEGTYLRPDLIQLFGAQRVLLEGFSATNSPFWVNHLVYTDHATVRGIRVDSHFPNNDGVDVESSTHVVVEDCVFRTGDDSVVIKSGRDLDGRTIGRPSRNIVVRNNDMGGEDGIGLGSEMSAGISEVYILDNTLRKGSSAFRFKSNLDRGGVVENIYIRGANVEDFENLFWFQLDYPSEHGGQFDTVYRNITFTDIQAANVGAVFFVRAPASAPLRDVRFENVTVDTSQQVFDIRNASNLQLNNVRVDDQVIDARIDSLAATEAAVE
ncbi:glycoside hydrolase family 28 protein [Parahaliea maris]|uniref:Glycoside hydrolase family 28 protein n=2 Tax=Parahaliea maris TaxID=2716870 RepID=A0A5C9AAR2_9GAMM|nr:glycoside hydrolase family 28 protein [Parahaliea maris]